MSKRLKILLIVFGVLLILVAGSAAYFMMTAETPEETTQVAVKTEAPKPAPASKPSPKPKTDEGQEAAPAAKPAPKPGPATEAEQEAPAGQPMPSAKPAPKPATGVEATAKPAKPESKPEAKTEAAKPASKPEAKPEAKPETAKTAAATAKAPGKKCEPVIEAVVEGKKKAFKTPEEFVSGAVMTPEEFRAFGEKFLVDKQKALADLKKKKDVPKEDIDCAQDYVTLAKSLKDFIVKKFPPRPEREVYSYMSLDKRDPFMSPFQIPKAPCRVPDNAPPIQQQPAETLKVDGIMWNEKGYRALMITEDGRGYTVKVGDKAGNKCGQITKITPTKVVITEWIPDIFDNIEVRETEIGLHK